VALGCFLCARVQSAPAERMPDGVNGPLEERIAALRQQLPPLQRHYEGLTESEAAAQIQQQRNYEKILGEKTRGEWFAALVSTSGEAPYAIQARFKTCRGLLDFIAERQALVEVWAYREGGPQNARRVPAPELAEIKRQPREQPLFVTITYPDPASGLVVKQQVEYGFDAATVALAAQQAYQRHRDLQVTAQAVLGARTEQGRLSARAQWAALEKAVQGGRFPLVQMPAEPVQDRDLFVAVEYEVDDSNLFVRPRAIWRESEVRPRVVRDAPGQYHQVLILRKPGEKGGLEVAAYRARGVSDELVLVPAPILGQDIIELRVKTPAEPDPRQWNVLEFGEPGLVREAALAQFSLVSAHLEKRRKEIALKKSSWDLVAEPVFAGLNIGGGLAGVPFPIGAAARLGYNALVTPWFIPDVPSVKQMRELFRLLAARSKLPELKTKPAHFLDEADLATLQKAARQLSDAEVVNYLQGINDDDLKAMLRLAKMKRIDDRVVNLLSIIADAGKVSGWTDAPGLQRDIFNNIYVSVAGDISIKNIIAVAVGGDVATPLSGVSLQDLSRGEGPAEAWLQYLDLTVDLRAVLNTLARLSHKDLAEKELKKPFPYAPRMSDLAAYEIRIFGYPLLMVYKRGLLKDDNRAFLEDYAYGFLGATLVEHFKTRAEMEAEVRAGRMVPLGFVRVPDGLGKWKESNLAVFAHRILAGKYKGKTAILIYGLKAYTEHSQLIHREYLRFREFQQALQEGGVVEQLVEAENPAAIAPLDFEPAVQVGPGAVQEQFAPLLGHLLEWRRHLQRAAWGLDQSESMSQSVSEGQLTNSSESVNQRVGEGKLTNSATQSALTGLAATRQALAAQGIRAQDGAPDPLLGVDRFGSTFLYRKVTHGQWRTIRLTSIPSRADMARERAKAEEAQRVEQARRQGVGEQGTGVVLINTVREANGVREVGPLWQGKTGEVIGSGVRTTGQDLASVLAALDRLPVVTGARLRANHFGATLVELDVQGDGQPQPVFLTLEFPPGKLLYRERVNPLSGAQETLHFQGGLWRGTTTDRRIVEVDYDADNLERATRQYHNAATRQNPVKGPLLEETQTLAVWHREISDESMSQRASEGQLANSLPPTSLIEPDPYLPVLSRVRFNHVTGEVVCETLGLFPQPVLTVDEQYVTRRRYNPYGLFVSASVLDNGTTESDFQRDLVTKLRQPIVGRERFQESREALNQPVGEVQLTNSPAQTALISSGRAPGYTTAVEQKDLLRGLVKTIVFDDARLGRKVSERWVDRFDGTRSFAEEVSIEYRDDFCFGLVPCTQRVMSQRVDEAKLTNSPTQSPLTLSETRTLQFDPRARRLTAVEVDWTGQARTNLWDYRWRSPIESETAGRKTTRQFNRTETAVSGASFSRVSGEELDRFTGEFDVLTQTWRQQRVCWFRPGLTNRTEREARSGFGRWISTRLGEVFEVRPSYDAHGREQAQRIAGRNPLNGQFDLLQEVVDDFHWDQGRREARVQTYLEGKPYDLFRRGTDAEGRTTLEGLRTLPGLDLRTRQNFDGDSERVVSAIQLLNNVPRLTRQTQSAQRQPDGSWWLPVTVTPSWGLVSTQMLVIGDLRSRPVSTVLETGERIAVREWFGDLALPKVTEVIDRQGRPTERWVTKPNAGVHEQIPFDLTARDQLSYWGAAALAEERASLRGTDVALFADAADLRTCYHLTNGWETPWFRIDPHGLRGIAVTLGGLRRSNVVAICAAQVQSPRPTPAGRNAPVLLLTEADLEGLFSHRVAQRSLDRGGHVLEETISRIPHFKDDDSPAWAVFQMPATKLQKLRYHYDRGWLFEQIDPLTGGRVLTFTNQPPPAGLRQQPVNQGPLPEMVTRVDDVQFVAEDSGGLGEISSYFARAIHSPRLLEINPHMPDCPEVWRSCFTTEQSVGGQPLFQSVTFTDAQGRNRVIQAAKTTRSGEPATKIIYELSAPRTEEMKEHLLVSGRQTMALDARGREDFAQSDFLYFYVTGLSNVAMTVLDRAGRTVLVSDVARGFERHEISPWLIHPANVRWLPDRAAPRLGLVLSAPAWLVQAGQVIALSVGDLDRAGLDVRRVSSFQLTVSNAAPVRLALSPVCVLARPGRLVRDEESPELSRTQQAHSSGLRTLVIAEKGREEREAYAGQRMTAAIDWRGRPVAAAYPHNPVAGFPLLVWLDAAEPGAPRPLYGLSPKDGHWVEQYRLLKLGDVEVCVEGQGFAVPRREFFRAQSLHDETDPSSTTYGEEYPFTIRSQVGAGVINHAWASVRQRVGANLFKSGAEQALRGLKDYQPATDLLTRFNYHPLHRADALAARIDRLPMLATALLPTRPLPWEKSESGNQRVSEGQFPNSRTYKFKPLTFPWDWLRLELNRRHLQYPTGLIPTVPESDAGRYVDTVEEADLIILAVKLGETGLARELLEFYWLKSHGGQLALHDSYDALAGTAKRVDVLCPRPLYARRTAESQLAIAEGAFYLGMETSDTQWLTLGRNLVSLLLREFRPPAESRESMNQRGGEGKLTNSLIQPSPTAAGGQLTNSPTQTSLMTAGGKLTNSLIQTSLARPRGISERQHLPIEHGHGFTLWPAPEQYSLRSNARAFLLLKQLNAVIKTHFSDPTWSFEILQASREEEAFLKSFFLPELERTGVAPNGAFLVQDIESETTALALERWTSAEDWLALLEAAAQMDVPSEILRHWLENLARLHGAQVQGVWGLDGQVALLRPEAISSDLTAKFLRVAHVLGHQTAETFAEQNLAALQKGDEFATVLTEAPPTRALVTAEGVAIHPHTNRVEWPGTLGPYRELRERLGPGWNLTRTAARLETKPVREVWPSQHEDLTAFVWVAAGFYLLILALSVFWWCFRALRHPRSNVESVNQSGAEGKLTNSLTQSSLVVPDAVMRRAEERWAQRVLGSQSPAQAEKWRFSNGAVEPNFLMQLRAVYKLVLEWRRLENGWSEDDPRLADTDTDPWLNGLDELAGLVGVYMRYVIKAGAKDGFSQPDPLAENEDGNHIWARLTMYFSEPLWGLLALVQEFKEAGNLLERASVSRKIQDLLRDMGLRRRPSAFDARHLFNFPVNPAAMDLLLLQRPGVTLAEVLSEAASKLDIPHQHVVGFVERYKEFKKRENPYPVHPYLLELAKGLPHFVLMGLGAIIWYNQRMGDSPILPYLHSMAMSYGLSPSSLVWALPLAAGLALNVVAHFLRVYRFQAAVRPREDGQMILDETLTSLFVRRHDSAAKTRSGRWWNPNPYEKCGWVLRAVGYGWLGVALLRLETPSFATFLIIKGLLAMVVLAEVGGIVVPLVVTTLSKFLQDRVSRIKPKSASKSDESASQRGGEGKTTHSRTRSSLTGLLRLANRLNLTATKPASPLWLSIKYHFQPSVPTGSTGELIQAIVSYFLLAGAFLLVGGYLCQEILSLWFTETYLAEADWKLFAGSLGFWSTMALLRYGLFLLCSGAASTLATFPVHTACAGFALLQLGLVLFGPSLGLEPSHFRPLCLALAALGLGLMLFGKDVHRWLSRRGREAAQPVQAVAGGDRSDQAASPAQPATLGVVYMSGDDLSSLKLAPELLMSRWRILRDKLSSEGLGLLASLGQSPDDATLQSWFQALRDAEARAGVTLWHPSQLCLAADTREGGTAASTGPGPAPAFPPESGLNIPVATPTERQQFLITWHLRRWLVSMMSTAGHSQDTGINLVDIAARLDREGLAPHTVFYLVQNKFDDSDKNRPAQLAYDAGELGQRNQLARLLCALAPGARAHCLHNWTAFGFKAGGLTGMDLVHEESLNLGTLLLLDRNATVHDLDGLMLDLRQALDDPNVIIVIPSRSTTNALTPIGQGSQMVEEGHRSFLKGLIACMGGGASEAVGTGWGNILACFYGRAQRALLDPHQRKKPLTSRLKRGASFADRTEGLIGFAPHAVGISEDVWAVGQAAHNAIALGHRVRFVLSRALWHKIRETWSHSEWLVSFPRWAGGYLQMMHDPVMQQIVDFGPPSIFSRELRANSGRIFLSAPLALLHILSMPLAILFDVAPFVQILLVLWNLGFVLNQVLTLHALNLYLESSGFYRLPALLGTVVTAGLCFLLPAWGPYAPGLVVLGFLAGGFLVGLSRWLATRLRDMVLFGPQLVLHTLGQVVRLSLEFITSGASPEDAKSVNMAFRTWVGPREDRPLERFSHFINLRTVVWGVGLPYFVLSALALYHLDLLNILLLLPLLLFSVSTVAGPFLFKPIVGLAAGPGLAPPKVLGWLTAAAFYMTLSWGAAVGGGPAWVASVLALTVSALLLRGALRYLPFRARVERQRRTLAKLVREAGGEPPLAEKIAAEVLQQCAADVSKVPAILARSGLAEAAQTGIVQLANTRLAPLLRAPAAEAGKTSWRGGRWRSEWFRACLLALLVLFWFFIVPVPGRITLSASNYQLTFGFGKLLLVSAWVLAGVALCAWTGRFIAWLELGVGRAAGLRPRCQRAFARLQALLESPAALSRSEIAHLYALLTDAQTYLDQRSHAYARRTLGNAEAILQEAERNGSRSRVGG
jgi:hypothetical protein